MAEKCKDDDFILSRDELKYLLGLDDLDETEALAVIAQQDEDGEHAFVDVLYEDVDLIIDGDWPVLKRGKELDLVNASLGPTLGVLDGNKDLFKEDLPKLCLEMPQRELEGSSQKNQLEYVFDVSMFTSEGLLAHGQARMEETVACCLGEFGGLLAEEKAPSLDGLLDEDLLVHGQARMEETQACRLDEFGGLLAEKKVPSSDGLLVDSEAQTLDDDADFVKFCLSIQETKDDWVNASANLIELGNEHATTSTLPCTYQREWQPWEQQAIQEMATTGNNKHGNHMDVLSVSASTWEQQAPQEMAAPSMKKRKAKQQASGEMAASSMKKRKAEQQTPQEMAAPRIDRTMMPHRDCLRCFSSNTCFDYNNNGKPNQPRYKCRSCDRDWTVGGKLRAAEGRKCKGKSANHNFNI